MSADQTPQTEQHLPSQTNPIGDQLCVRLLQIHQPQQAGEHDIETCEQYQPLVERYLPLWAESPSSCW
jgi:hypothetical protein